MPNEELPHSELMHAPLDQRPRTPDEDRVEAVLQEFAGNTEELARQYVAKEDEVEEYARNEATGLEGARRLNEYLTLKLHEAALNGGKVGVVFIDLKGLKELNKIFGHPGGNELLKVVGEWLMSRTRQTGETDDGETRVQDRVFHPHGDEFVGILNDYKLEDEEELDRRAQEDEEDLEKVLQTKLSSMKREDGKTADEPIITGATVALVISDGNESAKEVLTRASLKCNQLKDEQAAQDPLYKSIHTRTKHSQDGFVTMIVVLLLVLIAAIILVYMRVVNATS